MSGKEAEGKIELMKRIKKGKLQESERLEFKSSLKLKKEICQTVSAFSNSDDGTILVEVTDKGNVRGLEVGKKTVEKLANHIKQHTDPQVYPKIGVEKANNKNVVAIEVKITSRTALSDLNGLLDKGLIERRGSGPETRHMLTTVRYRTTPYDEKKNKGVRRMKYVLC